MAYCYEIGVEDLLDVEPTHIKDYVEGLKDAGKKAAAKSAFYAGKAFFQHCVEDGVLSTNPAGSVKVKFPKSKYGKTAILSPDQVNTLILYFCPYRRRPLLPSQGFLF